MNYKIKIEGQEIDMQEEIAGNDAALKSALAPFFPGAANAKFLRSEEKDGVITVTVVKQAGTKGASPSSINIVLLKAAEKSETQLFLDDHLPGSDEDQVLRKLIEAPQGVNPVVALDNEMEGRLLNQMSVERLLLLNDQIDEVITIGQDEHSKMDSTLRGLDQIKAAPSLAVVTGF